jgi:hypothetical protein
VRRGRVPLDRSNERSWIPRERAIYRVYLPGMRWEKSPAVGREHQVKVKTDVTGGLRRLTDGKPWVILNQGERLPGYLRQAMKFVGAGLAELYPVSAGGLLEEPGVASGNRTWHARCAGVRGVAVRPGTA